MVWRNYIEQIPGVAAGKPNFKGTRLTVEFVLERLSDGAKAQDLVHVYEVLRPEDVRAALQYAVEIVKRTKLDVATYADEAAPFEGAA